MASQLRIVIPTNQAKCLLSSMFALQKHHESSIRSTDGICQCVEGSRHHHWDQLAVKELRICEIAQRYDNRRDRALPVVEELHQQAGYKTGIVVSKA
jgi:hypothetical protein